MMENQKKHSLGRRAFFLFLSRRMKPVLFWFAVTAAAWYGKQWIPAPYYDWGGYFATFLLLLSGAYFAFVLMQALLEYHYYTYMFTDEAFVMTYGYVTRNEVTALYHQIQNVNIYRGPLDRIVGVSQIVIFMTGSEKDAAHNKITLPAVGRNKAKMVQKELLVRARRHVPSQSV